MQTKTEKEGIESMNTNITAAPEERIPIRRIPVRKKKAVSKKKKSSSKRIMIFLLILLLIGGLAFGTYWLFFRETPKTALTDTTIYGSLDRSIEGSGTTVPTESLSITAVSNAEIKEVYVSVGDFVEVGDLLYTQDDSEIDEKLLGYEEQIESYLDEITEYEASIADQENSISETNEKIAGYYEDIAEMQETLASLNVTAPFAGKITNVAVEVGDNLKNNASLALLTDESTMKVSQYFSYAYADSVSIGMPAKVSVDGLMYTLDGKVSDVQWIEWISDEGMKCFAVTVELENPGILTEKQTASAYLVSQTGSIYPTTEGTLSYRNSETLTSPAEGELLAAYVTDYSAVYAGQTLFIIDSESYNGQIESVQKQIESAQKQIESAEKQITNYQKKIDSANEKINDLYTSIEETEASRADYAMCSEISGKVMYVNIEPGDKPNSMMSVITIYNLESMTISVNFDELDVDYISEGTEVTITRTSAETTTEYPGVITYLSPEASSSGGVATFTATIEIESAGELSSGVSVAYKISLGDSEEGVLAPVSALKNHEDQYYLYVKSDTRPANAVDLTDPETEIPDGFWAVPVEVGSSNSQYIRILSGVEEDTEVFTRYRQNAPTTGSTTSQMEDEEMSFEDMFANGGFGNMGGMSGMPNMNGGGSSGSRPGSGGSSGMPNMGGFSGGGRG